MVLGPSCAQGSSRFDWSLDIPDLDNIPPYKPPKVPTNLEKVSKVLQISDPHIQVNYSIGRPPTIIVKRR